MIKLVLDLFLKKNIRNLTVFQEITLPPTQVCKSHAINDHVSTVLLGPFLMIKSAFAISFPSPVN